MCINPRATEPLALRRLQQLPWCRCVEERHAGGALATGFANGLATDWWLPRLPTGWVRWRLVRLANDDVRWRLVVRQRVRQRSVLPTSPTSPTSIVIEGGLTSGRHCAVARSRVLD